MKIENIKIYGIEESIIASTYPMSEKILKEDKMTEKHLKRASTLGNAKHGSGHDCYLKGITVQADLTCSQAMHMQILRYHFLDVISSQSKMHKLTKMDIRKKCNKYVTQPTINELNELIGEYNGMIEDNTIDECYTKEEVEKAYLRVLYNCPMGLELTFRFTTNYLQLKTIYLQRKNHRLPEWRAFCEWIGSLKHFKEMTGNA